MGDRNEAEERHGKGVAHLPNGDIYDGEYNCGKRHGKVCRCLVSELHIKYKFHECVASISLNREHINSSLVRGTLENTWTIRSMDMDCSITQMAPIMMVRPCQHLYLPMAPVIGTNSSLGMWMDDLRNGQGTYTYANGDTYEGEWSNNLRHGEGSYTYSASGAKYTGNWMNGRRDATGQLLYANYRYKGLFSADQVMQWSGMGTCSV